MMTSFLPFSPLCFALFIPLIGFLILMFSSSRISRTTAGIVACSTIFLSFLSFVSFLIGNHQLPENIVFFNWIPLESLHADFAIRLDQLSLLMSLIITGVGFLIHVYAIGYIDHEDDYARFFACLNFFVFAMLLLVLASNLLVLFVGWEGVGLASYLLIGYWYHKPSAANAATKAFVVNRIGDLGFLLGLLLTFYTFGTSDIATISQEMQSGPGSTTITAITLLLFIGAVGKSAQLPLHTWLPDAMEGPTPVSALIHAATMVTAGVYLVVRMHVFYDLAPETLNLIAVIGTATALFAALSAVGQTDLKRVLAYSTVSQLGLMFLACGVGAYYAAMFHLTTHAFVKALLFLSAGNVVHMMHGTTEMKEMGGLKNTFTKTHWLFLIGVLAMSGIPPLAAFFSKDLILEASHEAGYNTLFWVGLATSILTAFYLTRAYFLAFMGQEQWKALTEKAHAYIIEAPKVMLLPVSVLAILAIFGGFLGFSLNGSSLLEGMLMPMGIVKHTAEEGFHLSMAAWLAIAGAFLGVLLGAYIYSREPGRSHKPLPMLKQAFYFDTIYDVLILRPLRGIANMINTFAEPHMFQGTINLVTETTHDVARNFQKFQSGQIRSYIAWMVLGMVALIVYFVLIPSS